MKNLLRLFVSSAALVVATTSCGSVDGPTTETAGAEDALAASLDQMTTFDSYRVTNWTAQTYRIPALGLDQVIEMDEDNPNNVSEITPEGNHAIFTFVFPVPPDGQAVASFELWETPTSITMDTNGYQAIADANPGVDLGPYRPGIFTVDPTRLSDPAAMSIAATDLKQLAELLRGAMDDLARSPSAPNVYTGTASYPDFLEAQGQDVRQLSDGLAAGMAQGSGGQINSVALSNYYFDLYSDATAELQIELDEDGNLYRLDVTVDLSEGISNMFVNDDMAAGLSDAERAEAIDSMAGSVLIVESRSVYELDNDVVIPPVPQATEDRTEELNAVLDLANG